MCILHCKSTLPQNTSFSGKSFRARFRVRLLETRHHLNTVHELSHLHSLKLKETTRATMMATEQPMAHMDEQQQYDEGEMGEEDVSQLRLNGTIASFCRHGILLQTLKLQTFSHLSIYYFATFTH